jgi:cytochrome oxidase assembly protein ShyY1
MKRFWQWSATALLVAIFLSLANWQWNRASELKNPPKIDPTIVPLDSLIAPGSAITDEQVARRVSVNGTYVSNWILPNQKDKKSWLIGLFQTKDNAMILVVRGYYKDIPTSI